MKTLSFNTGRLYGREGQRIVAVCDGETVIFRDFDRMIIGALPASVIGDVTPRRIMQAYDRGAYVTEWHLNRQDASVKAMLAELAKAGTPDGISLTALPAALQI